MTIQNEKEELNRHVSRTAAVICVYQYLIWPRDAEILLEDAEETDIRNDEYMGRVVDTAVREKDRYIGYINQVLDLPVRHGLMACQEADLDSIRRVYSHSQALHQCERYLQNRGWETVECVNTAVAARQVRDMNDPAAAAIASEETAELYGLKLLEGGINDEANNTTRFAVLSRSQNRPGRTGLRDNAGFILLFTVQNKAGALAQTLNIIGAHGYNMKNLRSRPMKDLQWNYYFYIEAEGNIATENGEMLMRELGALCARLKLVGIY